MGKGEFNSLLPSATVQERKIEETLQRSGELPVSIQDMWNPEKCPLNLLPWLAWALSVDNWDSRWPESVKREVIRESVKVHRKKGTRSAVENALKALGVRIDLTEWFEEENDVQPHTFTLTARANNALTQGSDTLLDQEFFNTVRATVDSTKPMRSHYQLRVGANFTNKLLVATLAKGGSYLRKHTAVTVKPIIRKSIFGFCARKKAASVVRLTMEVL